MRVSTPVEIQARTDVGLQRNNNEDALLVVEQEGLCVVADGMGGHLGGEVASSMVTEALLDEFRGGTLDLAHEEDTAVVEHLVGAIERANASIHRRGNNDIKLRNMGTTVVASVFRGKTVCCASVGDSRIYLLRDRTLGQVTEDHSWVGELRRRNLISPEDARRHPLRNIITRALGMEASVVVDARVLETKPGDIFLLCSDGLTDLVTDDEIEAALLEHQDNLAEAAEALIDAANDMGGADNITVALCRVQES